MTPETYRHRASGVVGYVTMRTGGPRETVTVACLSDLRTAHTLAGFPFRVTSTATLQPCCIRQGSDTGWYGGSCPVHGAPFYLTQYSTEPLTMDRREFDAEWEGQP